MIVELAVGIAANLPMESRDVFVEYVYPNSRIDENVMKLESGLPALTNPGEGIAEDSASRSSLDKDHPDGNDGSSMQESIEDAEREQKEAQQQQQQAQAQKKKGSMFGGFMGGKKAGAVPGGSGVAVAQQQQQLAKEKEKEERVRFCAFMAVEVRGRSVLMKAPVWTHGV